MPASRARRLTAAVVGLLLLAGAVTVSLVVADDQAEPDPVTSAEG